MSLLGKPKALRSTNNWSMMFDAKDMTQTNQLKRARFQNESHGTGELWNASLQLNAPLRKDSLDLRGLASKQKETDSEDETCEDLSNENQ